MLKRAGLLPNENLLPKAKDDEEQTLRRLDRMISFD